MKPASPKYQPFPRVDLPDRRWPSRQILKAPRWCSVDLRDGNQALINPMNYVQKKELFALLVAMGFKEIEIGFPSASETEFEFTRGLLEENLIPDDVLPQILVQAKESLIRKSVAALKGYKRVIFHVYNSTSEVQRRLVFRQGRKEIQQLAVDAVSLVRELASAHPETEFILEYSPESFMATELEFSLEICSAVCDAWGVGKEKGAIINLPNTVELGPPNGYADQIEWFSRHFPYRAHTVLSVHTHNDRGTGVAASELALLAGADRVEGTLFGNGERTGNLDIINLALNLYTHGIEPNLVIDSIDHIAEVYSRCTGMDVHARHPYAGSLVYTAFSGSHQDAIKKGMDARKSGDHSQERWEVPYLPIDPVDLGRTYEAIIRINSQSGKGGVAYVMEQQFGVDLPKAMHPEFGALVQRLSDERKRELEFNDIYNVFKREYLDALEPYALREVSFDFSGPSIVDVIIHLATREGTVKASGKGNGPLDAVRTALQSLLEFPFDITFYSQEATRQGSDSDAMSFIEISSNGESFFGVGVDADIIKSSIRALLSGLNRLKKRRRS
jgi:2-isopropylmalate synthase